MPRRSPEYMEKQRLRFCEAAQACFRRKGVAATSLTEICEEAGLSMGALYKHFESRDKLMVEIIKVRIARRAERLRGATWAELRQALLEHRKNHERDIFSGELRAIVDWNGQLKGMRRQAAEDIFRQIEEQLAAFAAAGEISPRFNMSRTAHLVGLIFDGSLVDFRTPDDLDEGLKNLGAYLDFAVGAV